MNLDYAEDYGQMEQETQEINDLLLGINGMVIFKELERKNRDYKIII